MATETEPVGVHGRRRLAAAGGAAWGAASSLGWYEAERQVVVADGAAWISKQTDWHFPRATKILDWPHLWRAVAKAVRSAV
ncbi:MAG: hypothetical protein H0V86_14345 [Chloroflexia bacterium]|nr:hypothetical protein [Chloroflexia bacterium]